MIWYVCWHRTSHAEEVPPQPQVGVAIGGATLVALAAGLNTVNLLADPSDSQTCLTWGCAGVAAGAMIEPIGASLLLVWAWQLGQSHESVARMKGDVQDHRLMRGTAAVIGLSSSLLKTFLFGHSLWLRQNGCSGSESDCHSERIRRSDSLSLALTPTLVLGALAAGYAIGYESGKPKGLTALTLMPLALPSGAGLGLYAGF
jgi:hypothetical protein